MTERPIESITLSEWCDLAEAAISLLSVSRFMQAMAEKDLDGSEMEALDRMAFVLEKIGMDQGTQADWNQKLAGLYQAVVVEGTSAEEWARRRELMQQAGGMKQ